MELKSKYSKEGVTKDAFRRELKEIDSATGMIELTPANTKFLTLSGDFLEQKETISFMILDATTIHEIQCHKAPKRATISRRVLTDWQMEEICQSNFMILNEGKVYLVDSSSVRWLLRLLGMQGQGISKPSFARDLYMTEVFQERKEKEPIRALYREKKYCINTATQKYVTIRKIINFVSPQYEYQPLAGMSKVLAEVTKKKGAQLVGWKTTIRDAQFRVEFPTLGEEYATAYGLSKVFIPGIVVRLSDGGDTGYSACQTLRVSGCSEYTIVNKDIAGVFASHRNMDVQSLAEQTSALTDTLCQVLQHLEGANVSFVQSKHMHSCMPKILDTYLAMCQAKGTLSERMKQEALSSLTDHVVHGQINSAADVIGLILTIPEILNRKINTTAMMDKLRVVCGRSVMVSFNEVLRRVDSDF